MKWFFRVYLCLEDMISMKKFQGLGRGRPTRSWFFSQKSPRKTKDFCYDVILTGNWPYRSNRRFYSLWFFPAEVLLLPIFRFVNFKCPAFAYMWMNRSTTVQSYKFTSVNFFLLRHIKVPIWSHDKIQAELSAATLTLHIVLEFFETLRKMVKHKFENTWHFVQ